MTISSAGMPGTRQKISHSLWIIYDVLPSYRSFVLILLMHFFLLLFQMNVLVSFLRLQMIVQMAVLAQPITWTTGLMAAARTPSASPAEKTRSLPQSAAGNSHTNHQHHRKWPTSSSSSSRNNDCVTMLLPWALRDFSSPICIPRRFFVLFLQTGNYNVKNGVSLSEVGVDVLLGLLAQRPWTTASSTTDRSSTTTEPSTVSTAQSATVDIETLPGKLGSFVASL